ncbi:MAG: FIST C-terminal domain-containing protein [Thiohalocapsa sp.]|nr:FIST C-terminal domain-containing protein [Thiohalocapsa sp.]
MEQSIADTEAATVLAAVRLVDADPQAFRRWLNQHCGALPGSGVWVLLPERAADVLPDLQRQANELGVPLAGAVFPAVLDEHGIYPQGLAAIAWRRMPAYVLLDSDGVANDRLVSSVEELLDRTASTSVDDHEVATLFMLFDAMLPSIGSLLDTLYLELGDRVRYAGVNAGSETFTPIPCLFDNTRCVQGGVLAALLPAVGAELEHGYREPDHLVAATATSGNRIREIDWRPAFDVYRERIRAQFHIDVDADNFYRMAVHFPFGIQRADGEVLVRIPVALEDDGSLFCVGEVPEHAILTLLEAPAEDSTAAAGALAERLGGGMAHAAATLLTFYWAGRRLHLGAGAAAREVRGLSERLGARPLLGALSLGEIGSSHRGGYPLYHNAAIVALETQTPRR